MTASQPRRQRWARRQLESPAGVDRSVRTAWGKRVGRAVLERVDLGEVPYPEAIEAMRGWVEQRRAGVIADRLALLTHPAVITYGSRTPPDELPRADSPVPLVEVDRGGQATYHGPGQLIGYLVMSLRERGPADIVRWVENALIRALDSLGFETVRRDTSPGAQSLVGV